MPTPRFDHGWWCFVIQHATNTYPYVTPECLYQILALQISKTLFKRGFRINCSLLLYLLIGFCIEAENFVVRACACVCVMMCLNNCQIKFFALLTFVVGKL